MTLLRSSGPWKTTRETEHQPKEDAFWSDRHCIFLGAIAGRQYLDNRHQKDSACCSHGTVSSHFHFHVHFHVTGSTMRIRICILNLPNDMIPGNREAERMEIISC